MLLVIIKAITNEQIPIFSKVLFVYKNRLKRNPKNCWSIKFFLILYKLFRKLISNKTISKFVYLAIWTNKVLKGLCMQYWIQIVM